MTNPIRDRILARRARFVGAAIASVGVVLASAQGCGGSQSPDVCLSIAPPPSGDAGAVEPAPTATMATDPQPSDTPDAGGGSEPLPPDVCLSVAPDPPPDQPPPPPPHPCLSMTPD